MPFIRRRKLFITLALVTCIFGILRLLKNNYLISTSPKHLRIHVDSENDESQGFAPQYVTEEIKNNATVMVLRKLNQTNGITHPTPVPKLIPPLTVIVNNHSIIPTVPPPPASVSMVKGNPDICRSSKDLKWIFYIHTAPENKEKRDNLRHTWGNKYLFDNRRSAFIFLLGIPRLQEERKIIDEEYKKYGDIVQGDFIEDYRNLTYKGILGLQFIYFYCSHVPYTIKTDDDVFSSIFKIMQLTEERGPLNRFLMCFRWNNMQVNRPEHSIYFKTWYLPHDVLPGKIIFDPYCAGLGWIFSTNIVKVLLTYVYSTPFLWIDDVYISGMVMNQVKNMSIIDLRTIVEVKTMLKDIRPFYADKCVFSHKSPELINLYWNETLHQLGDDMLRELNMSALAQFPELLQRRKKLRSTAWTNREFSFQMTNWALRWYHYIDYIDYIHYVELHIVSCTLCCCMHIIVCSRKMINIWLLLHGAPFTNMV